MSPAAEPTVHAHPPAAGRWPPDPRRPVATVAGRVLGWPQLRARMAAIRAGPAAQRLPLPGSPEDRRLWRWVARLLVTEAVLVHEARVAGLPVPGGGHPPVPAAPGPPVTANGASVLGAMQLGDTARRLFERVTGDVRVGDDAVRAYYHANPDRYRRAGSRRVRHVLVADARSAAAVARRAAAGADLADLARRHSLDAGSRARGGDLGEVRRGELAGPFEDAAFSAAPGTLTGPVRSVFGWHVLRVEAVTPAVEVPLEQAAAGIHADLLAAARGRAFDDWLERRRRALVRLDPAWEHPGDPYHADSVHRH